MWTRRKRNSKLQKNEKIYDEIGCGDPGVVALYGTSTVPSSINIYFEDTTLHIEQKQIPSEKVIEQIGESNPCHL